MALASVLEPPQRRFLVFVRSGGRNGGRGGRIDVQLSTQG